jgi:hypothetical protein
VFAKVKSLHAIGIQVVLHCFEYDRPPHPELNRYCKEVHYYQRKSGLAYFFNDLPYIVNSRQSDKLINRLAHDNFPILFEGLHCCYYLNDERLKNRILAVRSHNIEHDYYAGLKKAESNLLKRFYFNIEAKKLRKFEGVYQFASLIFAISSNDKNYFDKQYSGTYLVSAFHLNEDVKISPGKGNFALYHGSLAVPENNQAALWLVKEVFAGLSIPLKIAGNHASAELRAAITRHEHIQLVENTNVDEIRQLVHEAHVNILPTFQATGIKLKLLMALFNGRFCIANRQMIHNTGLESLCIEANGAEDMKTAILSTFGMEFNDEQIQKRKEILESDFSNINNAKKIDSLIFGSQ